ncbi:MAG: 1-deoxy-D-xylulose-5-phosphate reductoisomerase, partial [archaeon]
NEFKIVGLTANSNIELLKKQIEEFKPEAVAVMQKEKADLLKEQTNIEVHSGMEGLIKIASLENANTVVNALVGSSGILPTVNAIKSKKNVALANKETLVVAGEIVMNLVKENNIALTPIDSEHSGLFQCLEKQNRDEIKKIIITASGGPFHNLKKEELENVTLQQALKHPTWQMGGKNTIDSATLMNKGNEVLEAMHLFQFPIEKIGAIIHEQSIVHALIEFIDGHFLAQFSKNDMKFPIQYALTYPKRFPNNLEKLGFENIKKLTFKKIEVGMFPCFKYAYEAGKIGGTMPAVLNAANEVAVQYFLQDKIKFLEIPRLIRKMMDEHNVIKSPDLDEILDVDKKIKGKTKKEIEG